MFTLRPVVVCSSTPSSDANKTRIARIRREWEAKRIDNLKKIQDVVRKTAEDDLETMLAIIREPPTKDADQKE